MHEISSIAVSITAVIVAGDLAVLCLAMYLLPTLIGRLRRVPDLGSVAVINMLLGWTVIGWVAALALALRSPAAPAAAVQVINHLPARGPADELSRAGQPGAYPRHPGAAPPLELPDYPAGPGAVR